MSTTLILLPDFALILFGYLLRRRNYFSGEFWLGLEKFIYFVLFPPLLFRALVGHRIDPGASAGMLLAGAGFTLGGVLLGYLARWLFRLANASFASGIQCAFRFNSYIGFAIVGSIDGQAGVAAIALLFGLMIPLVNVISVLMLAKHSQQGMWRELAGNPLILGIIVGVASNLAGLRPPQVLLHSIGPLADAALPLGLMTVGAGLRFTEWRRNPGAIVYWSGIKLVAVPMLALLLCSAFGLTGVQRHAALVMAALPAATSSYILAVRMGGDGRLAAALVTSTTLAAMLTIPLWLGLFL